MSTTDRPFPGPEAGNETTIPGAEAGKEVAGHARSEVEDAVQHAAEEAREVVDVARSEVRDVVDEARDAVRTQADRQAHVAADALGRFRDDLQAMKDGGDGPRESTAVHLERAASALDGVIDRLEREGIEGALGGVRSFARRSPGGFLFATAGAGFALGRLLRNADHPQQVDEASDQGASGDGHDPLGRQPEIDLTSGGPARFEAAEQREAAFAGREMPR